MKERKRERKRERGKRDKERQRDGEGERTREGEREGVRENKDHQVDSLFKLANMTQCLNFCVNSASLATSFKKCNVIMT